MKPPPSIRALTCTLALLFAVPALAQSIVSTPAGTAPRIDGRIDFREWSMFSAVGIENGVIFIANDRTRLYILVDLLDDDFADPRTSHSEGDWVEIFIDMDADGMVTSNLDRVYTLLPASYDLRVQKLASSANDRLPVETEPSYSSIAVGFGCFTDDGTSVLYSPPHAPLCQAHRVWEVAIDLAEIGQNPSSPLPPLHDLRLGVLAHSRNPSFQEEIPAGFLDDFGQMFEIDLASFAPIVVDPSAQIGFDREETDDNDDGILDDPLEVTQAIQTRGNTLRLVADKTTAVRVYTEVRQEDPPQTVTVSLYGRRDGHDLPGSPLSVRATAPPDFEYPRIVFRDPDDPDRPARNGIRKGRDNLNHTANFLLPESWTRRGVSFEARARFLTQEIVSRRVYVTFERRRIPLYVVIPIDEGTEGAPLKPDDADLARAESYLKTVYPVPDVNFVRMEYLPFRIAPTLVDPVILRATILEELIRIYNMLVATGVDPLPEQIYGYTVTSRFGQAATWNDVTCTDPGCGHVAGGDTILVRDGVTYYNDTDMAHEFNHNIGDPDTWADHVPGPSVDLSSLDPEWVRLWEESEGGLDPQYQTYHIREFGFDTRRPWTNGYDLLLAPFWERRFTSVPPYFAELMSYETSWVQDLGVFGLPTPINMQPLKWTSPYRWERMFDVFALDPVEPPTPPLRGRRPSVYVSGRVYQDRHVELDPMFLLPGVPRFARDPNGELTLEIQYAGEKLLQITFTPDLVDSEDNQLDEAAFHFNLPVLPNTSRVTVRQGQKVLDEIRVSKHAPRVEIRQPFGKGEWNGRQVLKWDAYDRDGDQLEYAVFYSPDHGKRWVPLKWGVTGNEYEVDMDRLPGGRAGMFKVVASDGYNTSEAISQSRLVVADKPPVITILQPPQKEIPQPPQNQQIEPVLEMSPGRIAFEAYASDLEDGSLGDESFLWFHGPQRDSLGRGKKIEANLSAGLHVITLVAFDSAGNTAERTIVLNLGQGQSDT